MGRGDRGEGYHAAARGGGGYHAAARVARRNRLVRSTVVLNNGVYTRVSLQERREGVHESCARQTDTCCVFTGGIFLVLGMITIIVGIVGFLSTAKIQGGSDGSLAISGLILCAVGISCFLLHYIIVRPIRKRNEIREAQQRQHVSWPTGVSGDPQVTRTFTSDDNGFSADNVTISHDSQQTVAIINIPPVEYEFQPSSFPSPPSYDSFDSPPSYDSFDSTPPPSYSFLF